MSSDEKEFLEALTDSTDVPPAQGDFSLEEILAEYGGSRGQVIIRDAERAMSAEEPAPEPRETEPPQEVELPRPPRPLSMEQVVGSTVDAVMSEREEPLLSPRRGLFSRQKLEETEDLYPEEKVEPPPKPKPAPKPEPPLLDSVSRFRDKLHRESSPLTLAFLLSLLPIVVLLAGRSGATIP